MPDQARVTSIEAIDAFRASLLLYLDKVRPAIDEVTADLRRTSLWLQTDRRLAWEQELRRCERDLDQAQQALLSARLSSLRDAATTEQAAVHRARRALERAREKNRRVKQWSRDFGPATESLVRQVAALDNFLAHDMVKAVARLTDILRQLETYSGLVPTGSAPLPSSAAGESPTTSAPHEVPTPDSAGTGGTSSVPGPTEGTGKPFVETLP